MSKEKEFIKNFDKRCDFVLFAVTDNLYNILKVFGNELNIKYIVDNDVKKQGKNINGIDIKCPEELKNENKNIRVIITSEYSPTVNEIKQQLDSMGFVYNRDYTKYKKIILYFKWYYENKISLPYTEIMITSKCSLLCKNCGLYIPYYKQHEHRTLEAIKQDLDSYFKTIDSVLAFHILGGEPLLHPQINEIINYIGEKYSKRIGIISIITNGTIMPSIDLLRVCQKFDIEFNISNYTLTLKYGKKIEELENILNKYNITYHSEILRKWLSLGSPLESRDLSSENLKKCFNDCQMRCRGLYNNKIYYCGSLSSAVYGKLYSAEIGDYIDLDKISNLTKDEIAKEIIDFELGENKKGYISFCQYCDGFGALNTNFVAPAEQENNQLGREKHEME